MRKTFRYRIYANNETLAKADNWLELCRGLYNAALAERIYAYKGQRKFVSWVDQSNELPELKQELPELAQVGSHVLTNVVKRVDLAYQGFFRRVKKCQKAGFPRFKSKGRYDSFTFPDGRNWKLDGKFLCIRNVGRFKLKLSREIQGNIKTVTLKKSATNKWYVLFSCDNVPEKRLEPSDKVIGLDMGIKSYLTDSEGHKIENPKFLKKSLKSLRIKQRKLARSKRGSNRRKKTRLLVANAHEKINNQRSDFLHKLSTQYVRDYGTIVIEDLAPANMMQNHRLSRDIGDCSWGKFFELLSYKAEEAGREVIENYRFAPTSKACSACGEINHSLKLSDREWVCLKCGTVHDRDINAAKNIVAMGLGEAFKRQRSEVSHA